MFSQQRSQGVLSLFIRENSFFMIKIQDNFKKNMIKELISKDKFEAVKRRRILNENAKNENRILVYLKKNKYSEEKYIDQKIKVVAESLKAKQVFIGELITICNVELLLNFIKGIIQRKHEENLMNFIVKKAQNTIYRRVYAFFVNKIGK